MENAEKGVRSATENPEEKFEREREKWWSDKGVVSLSFRRHSRYDYGGEKIPAGSLTSEGITLAREEARKWKEALPDDAKVTIFESPSFIPAGMREKPEPHMLMPSRARQTASIYEKEVFGDLAPAEEGDDPLYKMQSTRRKLASNLGDFMEHVTEEEAAFIPAFFKTRKEVYGDDIGKFWEDFTAGTLEPRVQEALEKCGGDGSRELAENLAAFIREATDGKREDSAGVLKEKTVNLAGTHGETMESFIHYVRQFLIAEDRQGDADAISAGTDFGYNKGFDAHVKNGELFIEGGREIVKVGDIDAFLEYLKKNKHE